MMLEGFVRDELKENFEKYDINHDGVVSSKDDLNGDGNISPEDRKLFEGKKRK